MTLGPSRKLEDPPNLLTDQNTNCNVPEACYISQKNAIVSKSLAQSPDYQENFNFLPEQALLELSPPIVRVLNRTLNTAITVLFSAVTLEYKAEAKPSTDRGTNLQLLLISGVIFLAVALDVGVDCTGCFGLLKCGRKGLQVHQYMGIADKCRYQ